MVQYTRGLTAQQAIEHARFTVAGSHGQFPGPVNPYGLVNEAGEWMVSAYEWHWCLGRITSLSTVAGVDSAELPDDYGGDIALFHSDNLVRRLDLVSMAEFLELRTTAPIQSGLISYATVSYTTPPSGGAPEPRLLLFPTPQTSEEDAYTIAYTARWKYVEEAEDYLQMPSYCVTLYLEILQHIARGRMEEDQGSVAQRLQNLRESDLFMAAIQADSRTQSDMGFMQNTHVQRRSGPFNFDDWGYVSGPS